MSYIRISVTTYQNSRSCPLAVEVFDSNTADLATLTRNTIVPNIAGARGWTQDTEPTPLQIRDIELLATHPMP